MPAKYQQLAEILRSEIQQIYRRGGHKLATEQELSQRYHMSRQTVRHALDLLEAEGLIERRQGSGSYLCRKRKEDDPRQIAIITTFLDDYVFPTILHDAQNCFSQAGYSTLVFATENHVGKEREILTRLLDQKISAILVEGSKTALPTPNEDLYLVLRSREIPVLFFHGVYSNLVSFPCLAECNYDGGRQLVRHLLSRGCTKIAGIFKSDDSQGPQRYHGVVSALRDARIPVRDTCFFWYDTEDRRELISGENGTLMKRFLQRFQNCNAVICYNDEIAHYLIRQLLDDGRRVPQDVAVVSFDNSYYSQIGPVTITSLGHRQRVGKAAAQLLLDMLDGKPSQSIDLDWELNQRNSG